LKNKIISLLMVVAILISMPIQAFGIGTPNASASTDYGNYIGYDGEGQGLWMYKSFKGHWPNGIRVSF
jgi:hypothetical protein